MSRHVILRLKPGENTITRRSIDAVIVNGTDIKSHIAQIRITQDADRHFPQVVITFAGAIEIETQPGGSADE